MDLSSLSFEGLRRARNLHPVFVHFPLALLPVSLGFYGVGAGARRSDFVFCGRAVLSVGAAFTILAWFTGFRAEATLGVVEPQSALLRAHLAFGSVLMAWTLMLFAASRARLDERPWLRWGFFVLLTLAVALSMVVGDLGAQLVYARGASVRDSQTPRSF